MRTEEPVFRMVVRYVYSTRGRSRIDSEKRITQIPPGSAPKKPVVPDLNRRISRRVNPRHAAHALASARVMAPQIAQETTADACRTLGQALARVGGKDPRTTPVLAAKYGILQRLGESRPNVQLVGSLCDPDRVSLDIGADVGEFRSRCWRRRGR
jgi:hypothetical protein